MLLGASGDLSGRLLLPALGQLLDAEEQRRNIVLIGAGTEEWDPSQMVAHLDLSAMGIDDSRAFEVQDLLSGSRFLWSGPREYVELTPLSLPGHILRVRRWARTERDFDYFL